MKHESDDFIPLETNSQSKEDKFSPLPSFRRVMSRTNQGKSSTGSRIDEANPADSLPQSYKVGTVHIEGETRTWAHPRYWDPENENYVGYWEHLDVSRPWWRGAPRFFAWSSLIVLFFVPEIIDGMWWLTLAISELVVGAIVILAIPRHRRRVALIVVSLALLGFGFLEAYNWVGFGTAGLYGPPPLILACGGEYQMTQASGISIPKGLVLHRVGTTPSGLAILGNNRCNSFSAVWAFVGLGNGKIVLYIEYNYSGDLTSYSS